MDLFETDDKKQDDQPMSLEESFAEGFKIAAKEEAEKKDSTDKKSKKKKKDKASELGSYT